MSISEAVDDKKDEIKSRVSRTGGVDAVAALPLT